MCGRFGRSRVVFQEEERWKAVQKMEADFGYKYITYNASPTTKQPVITHSKPDEIQFFTWGLIPRNSDSSSQSFPWFNARAENLHSTYPWNLIYPRQRCLVPADFFYEWPKSGGKPVKGANPFLFKMANESSFNFAGIWDAWKNPSTGQWIPSFAIITTRPNELIEEIHDRMPVILSKEDESLWLNSGTTVQVLDSLLIPFSSFQMQAYPVSRDVGKVQNDYPSLSDPFKSL